MTQAFAPTIASVVAKQQLISLKLRNDIIEGRLSPGGRLPTQAKLVEQFGVSPVTVQRAIERLSREGFILTRGRNGTFVTPHPPHLFSYGVVFRDQPRAGRSRYHEMIEAEAVQLQRSGDRRITIFNGITGREDTEASRELLGLVRSHQLAGLLLIDGDTFGGTPLLDEPGICRAAIMSRQTDSLGQGPLGCPIIFPDMHGMIDLALQTLIKRGRRQLACVITVPVYQFIGDYLRQAIHAVGLETKESWLQILPHDIPEAARNSVALLMTTSGERPDCLFVVDDNLAEWASVGLVTSGVQVSVEMDVIAHCNFPRAGASLLPITRVGFDTHQIMETAVNTIDLQRRGLQALAVTKISAMLEEALQKP